jgi:hypothetical protein
MRAAYKIQLEKLHRKKSFGRSRHRMGRGDNNKMDLSGCTKEKYLLWLKYAIILFYCKLICCNMKTERDRQVTAQ